MRCYVVILGVICFLGLACSNKTQQVIRYDPYNPDTILKRFEEKAERYHGVVPIELDLELNKKILEPGEMPLLTVQISNLLKVNQIIRIAPGIFDQENQFFLFVEAPDGEKRVYGIGGNVDYSRSARIYCYLYPEETLQESAILDFQRVIPMHSRDSLGRFLPGNYKLFAVFSYRLTSNKQLRDALVYSDTILVTIKSANIEYDTVLVYQDSLQDKNISTAQEVSLYKRISQTNTPYSEAAWIKFLTQSVYSLSFDSFVVETERFYTKYPESAYREVLLRVELHKYLQSESESYVDAIRLDLDNTAKSILDELIKLAPRSVIVLRYTQPERFISSQDLDSIVTGREK